MPCKTMTDMEKVVEVLTNAAEYPAPSPISARSMLAGGLPHALPAGAEAHTFQTEIVDLVAALLEEVRSEAEGVLTSGGAQTAEAEAQRDAAEAERAAAAEKSASAKAEVDAREATLRAAKAEVKSNEALHKEAKQAEAKVLKEKAGLSQKKEELDSLAAALKTFEEGQGEAPVDDVLSYLDEISAEKALVAAVPGAFQRLPAERGAFDTITLAEVSDLLSQSLTSINAELAEGQQAETHISAEALGAWAVLDVAQEKAAQAASAVCEAQEELQAATAALEAADKLLAERNNTVSDALVQKTLAEEKVSEITEAACALERLRNPPPPPQPSAEEPAAEQAEATAMEVEENKAEAAPMDISEGKNAADVSESKVPEAEVGLDVSRIPTPQHA